ncbi:DUF6194 family protein [Parasulfitobacter algicola]|uniref:DUF6194 family protein n=1 Tax=Parasulfitobacter algicola TaxID=2614809 RepID=UPI0031B5C590
MAYAHGSDHPFLLHLRYLELFGPPTPRLGKGGVIEGNWHFTAKNTLTPHPIYGWMSWFSILNLQGCEGANN